MKDMYKQLLSFFQKEDKQSALAFSMKILEEENVSVVEFYENLLTPALNNVIEEYPDPDELIWREHVRSGIVRTIIESAYPYVMKERQEIRNEVVIVMCPQYEKHELGARMVTDFFTIAGYDATFLGALTPHKTLLKSIDIIKPKYLSISVTNYFNLRDAKTTIEEVRKNTKDDLIFLVGGRAFSSNPTVHKDIGSDHLLHSFEDIKNLHKEVL